ncbi:MAG TPA: DoxX family protein [Luteimonas sp.]|nr:DoxX family protein [Luteimonas sp.]
MSFRPSQSNPGTTLARLLLASMFIVMGAWRLWAAYQGTPASGATLTFSAAELVLGVLVAAGWKLRWTALLSAALLVADAVMSHPFWSLAGAARDAQLLHFMKNVAIVGGFVLLSLTAPVARRR